ncbi:MAG: glycosyltransferase family 4 protein [Planctomycetota bacterium]
MMVGKSERTDNLNQPRQLVALTNIPTPYRTAFYDELAVQCESLGGRLAVLYCSESEPDRHWPVNSDSFRHTHEFLPGRSLRFRDITFHFNVSVASRIAHYQPSVLLCAGAWNMPTSLLANSRLPKDVRSVFWSEGHSAAVRNPRGPVAWLRRQVLGGFDCFAVPNQRSAEWLESELRRPVRTIRLPNTVKEEDYQLPSESDRVEEKKRLGIDRFGCVLVQVSRMENRKGVIELCRSFCSLPQQETEPQALVLIGEGSKVDELRAIAGSAPQNRTIIFTGSLDGSDVASWLRASDWFVLNSMVDPNPLTPIEASFCGTPLILSKRAGNHGELICDGAAGISIDSPVDPTAALVAATRMDAATRARMGARARQNACRHFTRKEAAARFAAEVFQP